jgi:hypothetical protein
MPDYQAFWPVTEAREVQEPYEERQVENPERKSKLVEIQRSQR